MRDDSKHSAGELIRFQTELIREDPAEYIARKYGIESVADELGKLEQTQESGG